VELLQRGRFLFLAFGQFLGLFLGRLFCHPFLSLFAFVIFLSLHVALLST
jgi:hypothetical protein